MAFESHKIFAGKAFYVTVLNYKLLFYVHVFVCFQLKDYDYELKSFEDQLFEFAIHFQPSYPFEENEHEGTKYMKTRCPAWCDRVVLSTGAKLLINEKVTVVLK